MKVAYLSPSGQLGGAEVSLLNMFASVRAAEPAWPLQLVVGEDGPLVTRATALGVQATVIPYPTTLARIGDAGTGGPAGYQQGRLSLFCDLFSASPSVLSYVRRLRHTLKELSPDVIHTNGFKMHVLGVWAKPQCVPVVWHIHDYVRARPVMAHLLRIHSARCAMVITNSRSVAADVSALCGKRAQVHVLYNGIDLKSFSPVGPTLDLDALSGLPPASSETIRVGMLATLARWKGHETFLRAMALIPEGLLVRGYMMGGALYQTSGSQHSLKEMRSLIGGLGLSHRVGLMGFVAQPAAAMRALDIVVHASTEPEPFGLVIAEGMACGRAVIISHAGGAAELVEAEVNALTHPPGDAEKLAERITELATNGELRAQLGAAGRATAQQRFNGARLATELIPIYHRVAQMN